MAKAQRLRGQPGQMGAERIEHLAQAGEGLGKLHPGLVERGVEP